MGLTAVVLRAGSLDRRVVLERRSEAVDPSGQVIASWDAIGTVWARVEPVGGQESFGEQQTVATADLRITLRWRGDLSPLHRVTYGGVPYDVVSVTEEGRREALVLLVRGRAERRP